MHVHEVSLRTLEFKLMTPNELLQPILAPISLKHEIVMIRHPVDPIIYLCNWKRGSFISLNFRTLVSAHKLFSFMFLILFCAAPSTLLMVSDFNRVSLKEDG